MKIGLCGTMSVGKTTLVNALKETKQFKDYNFATERSQHLMSLGIPLNTDSTLKGQTVSSSYKPATLDNGLSIQVPPFIESGDEVIIDTRNLEYIKKI